jgi:hypothetical protein
MLAMFSYSKAAVERAMKSTGSDVAGWAKKITGWQAAEILGISDRHLRRIREGYEKLFRFVGSAARLAFTQARPRGHAGEGAGTLMGRSISI